MTTVLEDTALYGPWHHYMNTTRHHLIFKPISRHTLVFRSSSNPNIYVSPWTGSSGTLFNDSITQTSALTVLLAAIQLVDVQSSSNSSVIPTSSGGRSLPSQSSPTPSVNPEKSSGPASSAKDLAGIIAGSLIGGMVLLTTLIMVTLFLRKLHHQRSHNPSVVDGSSLMVMPFTATQSMASSGILGEQHQRTQVKSARFRVPGVAMGEEPSLRATDNGSVRISRMNVLTEPMASPRTQVASPENPLHGNRREHTLLEELLRSINDWMSWNRWNAEEMPPGYHEGYTM
ncbi:hypothetical protein EDD85DRAFT_791042 [Armillaria nabsnona]|nr:hypothetical protein EDD85DRAFT_791042 [Armillaria nabsnona]